MSLVSIIIPAYNTEKYIRKCLISVINQTYKNLEIIIINDASSDNTLQIINEFARKDIRIKVINHETNKGNGVGRNNAIKQATGKYIYFVDSDDFIEKHTIETAVTQMLEKDVDVLLLGHIQYRFEQKIVKKFTHFIPEITGKESKEELFKFYLLSVGGFNPAPWKYFVKTAFGHCSCSL